MPRTTNAQMQGRESAHNKVQRLPREPVRAEALLPPTVMEANDVTEAAVNSAMVARYAMPPVVLAALRQAGKMAAARLLQTLSSADFHTMRPRDQLAFIQLGLAQAYGAPESATSSLNLAHKTGNLTALDAKGNTALGAQLEELERRRTLPELNKALQQQDDDDA